jgi:RNA polymerase sigma-70 factor (ECF subfamily)
MTHDLPRWKERIADALPPPRDVGEALNALSDDDLLRLRALARLRARGLPGGVGWSDLLHEAMLRALDGTRRWPPGVPLLAFLAGIMRSLSDAHWRRRRREAMAPRSDQTAMALIVGETSEPDPERLYAASQALAAVDRLFASDAEALKVIAGLSNDMAAEDIQRHYGLTAVEYDTTRRRMRRALLRHGLAWTWP